MTASTLTKIAAALVLAGAALSLTGCGLDAEDGAKSAPAPAPAETTAAPETPGDLTEGVRTVLQSSVDAGHAPAVYTSDEVVDCYVDTISTAGFSDDALAKFASGELAGIEDVSTQFAEDDALIWNSEDMILSIAGCVQGLLGDDGPITEAE